MPSAELQVLHVVVTRLAEAQTPYMLSGSTALGTYATPRMTRALDFVVQLDESDVEKFVGLFADDFYCDADAVRRAVTSRGMVNLIDLQRVVKVDVIVRKDSPYRRLEFERRRLARIDGQDMWVVSPEDLVLSKLHWSKESRSETQLGDVRDVLATVTDLDWPYLERWAAELSVAALLDEARRR